MTDAAQVAASRRTGRQVLGWFVVGFGVIIAVNVFMATQAVRTFPGMEVANSYVASQSFDRDREAQLRLGWTVTPRVEAGLLKVSVAGPDGGAVVPDVVSAVIGRSTERKDDVTLPLMAVAVGDLVAPVDLQPGMWVLWLELKAADGTSFRQRREIVVR